MSREAPRHATSAVYSQGDYVYVQLVADKGYTQELSFPATTLGMAALLRLLRAREIAPASQSHYFAGPTMPIQHVVDSWASDPNAESKARKAREQNERERFARKPRKEQMAELAELFSDPSFEF